MPGGRFAAMDSCAPEDAFPVLQKTTMTEVRRPDDRERKAGHTGGFVEAGRADVQLGMKRTCEIIDDADAPTAVHGALQGLWVGHTVLGIGDEPDLADAALVKDFFARLNPDAET